MRLSMSAVLLIAARFTGSVFAFSPNAGIAVAQSSLARAGPPRAQEFGFAARDNSGRGDAEARRLARAARAQRIEPAANSDAEAIPRLEEHVNTLPQVPPPMPPQPAPPQPDPPPTTAKSDYEKTVQLAIDAAAAAVAAVLRSGECDVDDATMARIIAGFSTKVRELCPLEAGGGDAAEPTAPAAEPEMSSAPASAPEPAKTPSAQAMERAQLVEVLTEFVKSDYGRRLCDEAKVQPMIGSNDILSVMFTKVVLTDAKLVVRLHRVFEQRSERLLEQLKKHLRAKMPQLERLQYEASSPPSTRTIIM